MLDNKNNLDNLNWNADSNETIISENENDCFFERDYNQTTPTELTQHKELQLAMKVGAMLTECGAEIRRVESTMDHIIRTVKGNIPHSNCTPGTVQATVTYSDGNSKTMIARIGTRNTDFKKIIRLNELSRNYSAKNLTYEEALVELDRINNMRIPPLYLRSLLNALSCGAFTFIITPTFGNIFACLIIGFFTMIIYESIFKVIALSNFMQTIIASAIITVFAFVLCDLGIGTSPNYIIIGGITPLLPGVETINAVRDIVESDYLSAITRILNAVLIGTAIAVGVAFVYLIMRNFGG